MGCSSAKLASRAGIVMISETQKKMRPKMTVADDIASSRGKSWLRAIQRMSHNKARGAKIPTHSYHRHCSKKK